MAAAIVIRDAENDWLEVPDSWPGKAKPGQPGANYKLLMRGGEGLPSIVHNRWEAGHLEPPHSHPDDEVLYVLCGHIAFGGQNLTSGDAIFVPKNTRYSLRAGDAGAEFVRVGMPV
jgi:mannose-6-phosphate isomerase-like protein (cupin superfamily)